MPIEHETPAPPDLAVATPRSAEERRAVLDGIAAEVRTCTRCRLAASRTNAVPGEGHPDTEVVFVGEGPGQNEDQQGRPFVGAAGGFLNELIGSIGWKREEVFITNVVKCRPPGNRDPEPDEIAACSGYLRRQLEALDPALVVTLGRFSLGTFMPGERIGQVHGTHRPVDPATGARSARAYAMYHPAAAFRQIALKATMQEEMTRIPEALLESRAARAAIDRPADPIPSPQDLPGTVPIDVPLPGPGAPLPGEPERAPVPIDEPLTPEPAPFPDPLPGTVPAGVLDAIPRDDDQLGLFR
jgi:DNA polymerase